MDNGANGGGNGKGAGRVVDPLKGRVAQGARSVVDPLARAAATPPVRPQPPQRGAQAGGGTAAGSPGKAANFGTPPRKPASWSRAKIVAYCLAALLLVGGAYTASACLSYSRLVDGKIALHKASRADERNALAAKMAKDTEAREARHNALLHDAKINSGQAAAELHAEEFRKRLGYDPSFARSVREKTILKMADIARDTSLQARDVVERIAAIAAPKDAKIKVSKASGSTFDIAVTFPMSALSYGESGASTKHHTLDALQDEVTTLIARGIKDMYDHCGLDHVRAIRMACTHGVKTGFLGSGPVVEKTLYGTTLARDTAKRMGAWRVVQLDAIKKAMAVDENLFPKLTLQRSPF
ncbi:MAG: hypothetical protein AB7E47_13035 [Desulfovibrionaceae bacterium]